MGRKKIASTAPLRQRRATESDFLHSGRLSYLFNEEARGTSRSPAQKLRLWNRFIPLSPQTAAEILERDLPADTLIFLDLENDGTGEILFYAEDKLRDDGSFDLRAKLLDAGIVRVQEGFKGRGIGRTLFRNQIEFFFACGVRRFEIEAALDNGGYTWARVGFLPEDIRDDEFIKECLEPARESVEVLRPLLAKRERKNLNKWLKPRRREDFWKIADAPIDLGGRLRSLFNAAAGADKAPDAEREKANKIVTALKEHFDEELFAYIKSRAANGQSVNIGRLLLTGTSWTGSLDMNNPKQMRRLGDYAGGWKYLKIG